MTSPTSTSQVLAGLPPELAFLKELDPDPGTRTQREDSFVLGSPEETFHKEFVLTSFDFVAAPQEVAHRLKAELTKERGWTLSFPEVGSYGARAEQLKNGVKGFKLRYTSGYPLDHSPSHLREGDPSGGQIDVWDNSKPTVHSPQPNFQVPAPRVVLEDNDPLTDALARHFTLRHSFSGSWIDFRAQMPLKR